MTNAPKFTKLDYSYKKENIDLWKLNLDDIPVDKDRIKVREIIHFPPGSVGGNHKHPRTEWFIGIGELVLYWQDEDGNKHENFLSNDEGLIMVQIPPFLPHAVKNVSEFKFGILLEYADAEQTDVQANPVI